MKKLLSLMLCIVFVCLALVGCKQDVIGEYLPNYTTGSVTDDQIEKLNFYIITGDNTSADAKITVPQNINTYLKEKYQIELNINYFTEAEYESKLYAALNTNVEAERPDIVLINSEGMFNQLLAGDDLVALNTGSFDFYNSSEFKSLNKSVDPVLLQASAVNGVYYTVPNNHKIGHYEYIVIDKAMARDTLHFSNQEIADMTTIPSLDALKAAITTYNSELDANHYVSVVTDGNYSDLEALKYINLQTNEKTDKEVNMVNVKAYPNATKEQAFLSAFAIVKQLNDTGNYDEDSEALLKNHYSKCMKIIYALNNDKELRNMLQYGYVGTNYSFVTNEKNENTNYINLIKGETVRYEMNIIHTGDPFISYYCNEISWNEDTANVWLRQNADAKTPENKISNELSSVFVKMLDFGTVVNGATIELPAFGETYTDVQFTWISDNAYAVIENGTVTFYNSTEATVEAVLKVTVSCNNMSTEDVSDIKIKVDPTPAA